MDHIYSHHQNLPAEKQKMKHHPLFHHAACFQWSEVINQPMNQLEKQIVISQNK